MATAKTAARSKPKKSSQPRRNVRQFVRYLLVGGGSVLLEYGSFYVLLQIYHVNYLIANSIVFCAVSAINFIINRIWTFRSTGPVGRQIAVNLVLLLFNFIGSNLILYILSGTLHIPPLWAKIVVTAMVVLWNFVLYKKVIYR